MKYTLFKGDTVHNVSIARGKKIEVRSVLMTSRHRRHSYITSYVGKSGNFHHGGKVSSFDGFPDPEHIQLSILVHRPWYNHIKALFHP